jgi:hypothetical protein
MIISRAVYDLSREQLFSQINDGLIKKETICDMIDMLITTVYGLPRESNVISLEDYKNSRGIE